MGEFFDISALSPVPAEEARQISTMWAWDCAKASMGGPAKKREGEASSAAPDPEEEADPSTRGGYLGGFCRWQKFSAPMHHQPSDKVLTI